MNKQQQIAAAWLPLIQAVAEGKTLQRLRIKQGTSEEVWCDMDLDIDVLNLWTSPGIQRVRIKPEPKKIKIKIALYKSLKTDKYFFEVYEDGSFVSHEAMQGNIRFVKWLDHIECELPESE